MTLVNENLGCPDIVEPYLQKALSSSRIIGNPVSVFGHATLSDLVARRWLHLLVGDMEGHIQVLRTTTDLISEAGFDVKLVGFLSGDNSTSGALPTWLLAISRLGVRSTGFLS